MTNDVEVQACRNCFVHAVNKPWSALRRLFTGVSLAGRALLSMAWVCPGHHAVRSKKDVYGKMKNERPCGGTGFDEDYIDFHARIHTKLATFQPLSSSV